MSEYHFNLVADPWIPCLMPSGGTQLLSLRDTLARSGEIAEVSDPSPVITASLHRLLVAIVHRVVDGPTDSRAWEELWRQGALTMDAFDAYFARWRHRFDLFDEEYPFYQWPGLDTSTPLPIAKLTHELASGNNATLFDHTTERAGSSLDPAAAARYLLAQQNYAVGGLVSYGPGEDPKRFKSADGAPLVRGAVTVVKGATLFETLLLNLQRYDPDQDEPFAIDEDAGDCPAWEREPPAQIEERRPYGYLDLLTWQSRRILLRPEATPHGVAVRLAVIMKGNQFPDTFDRRSAEVMQAFKKLERPSAGQDPWQPVGFREDRALWRDSLAFMHVLPDQSERPRILSWLDALAEKGIIDRGRAVPLDLYGLSTDKAKVLFWRQERLVLPLAYLADGELRIALELELSMADRVGQALGAGTRELARLLLAPAAGEAGRDPAPEDVRRLTDALSEGRTYWSRLAVPFRTLVQALPNEARPREDAPPGIAAQAWRTVLERAARQAFDATIAGLDNTARNLRATAAAERLFNRRLREVLEPGESNKQGGGTAA